MLIIHRLMFSLFCLHLIEYWIWFINYNSVGPVGKSQLHILHAAICFSRSIWYGRSKFRKLQLHWFQATLSTPNMVSINFILIWRTWDNIRICGLIGLCMFVAHISSGFRSKDVKRWAIYLSSCSFSYPTDKSTRFELELLLEFVM